MQDAARLSDWRQRGRALVGGTAKNACAATASQPFLDLGVIRDPFTWAETLVARLKATGLLSGNDDRADVQVGDLIVCEDGNHNGATDHVWLVVKVYSGGWYGCFDNQTKYLIHRRRLDGGDGRTPMRGRLRLLT